MPDRDEQYRTVLITGAARRIGRTLALDLAARGWRVGVHYRSSRADARALVSEIRASGGAAEELPADLARQDELEALLPRCKDALDAPSCLINNAAEFDIDSIADLTSECWDRHLTVNLKAPVFLAKAFAAHLPGTATGVLINIIDQRACRPTPEFFSYTVAKAGLWAATRMLARALAPRIRVNAVGPGPVLRSVHQTAAEFDAERASTPLRRGTTPEEIAAAVQFILAAPAMTGQMIMLDGGQHLAPSGAPDDAPAASVSRSRP